MNLFQKFKKIFLIIGFIAVVFILGYFIYSLFFKTSLGPKPIETTPISTSTGSGLPNSPEGGGQIITEQGEQNLPDTNDTATTAPDETAKGGITKTEELTKSASLGATMGKDGSGLQYYNKDDGKFYRIDKNGNAELLSDKVFYNVQEVTWSPVKDKAILEYPDGANVIYDFNTDKQITLPAHWKDFDFSPDGNQIILKSIGLDPDNRWLAISNEDASKVKPIEAIGLNEANVYPSWSPNKQTIAIYTEGVDFNRQEVFFVGQNGENFKSTIIEGRGLQSKWSPSGDRLLYSVYSNDNDYKPLLWLVGAAGEDIGNGRKSLEIETWADKCVFQSQSDIYCAVPESLEKGAGIFPELAKNTVDKIYKINSVTGIKTVVAIPDSAHNASNLIISDDEKYLYFTDNNSGKIYKINL